MLFDYSRTRTPFRLGSLPKSPKFTLLFTPPTVTTTRNNHATEQQRKHRKDAYAHTWRSARTCLPSPPLLLTMAFVGQREDAETLKTATMLAVRESLDPHAAWRNAAMLTGGNEDGGRDGRGGRSGRGGRDGGAHAGLDQKERHQRQEQQQQLGPPCASALSARWKSCLLPR